MVTIPDWRSAILTSWFSRPVHGHLDGMGIGGVLDWVRQNTDGDSEHLPCKDHTDKKLVWHFRKCWQGRQYFKSHKCTHAVVGSDHHSTILMNVNMGESHFRPRFSFDYNLEAIGAEHWLVLLQTARSES